ncbi:MAG: hypothetical protein KF787_12525 [Phycisphaeraceae bacterium]|nr:hypothetical protein [Phycisphaerae bacterium]MBX3393461.1 hypothetical protein [Phycisphaeraceae bacterium]
METPREGIRSSTASRRACAAASRLACLALAIGFAQACSTWPSSRPAPAYPPDTRNRPEDPAGRRRDPPPPPPPSASSSSTLTFTPRAILAQAGRAIDPLADALPTGLTFEGVVRSSSGWPFAVEPELDITEARDELGRSLATLRHGLPRPDTRIGGGRAGSYVDPTAGPRWVVPADARSSHAVVTARILDLDALPRKLSILRGSAIGYVVTGAQSRDVGITQTGRRSELLPGLHVTIRSIQTFNDTIAVESLIETAAAATGRSTDTPRIIRAALLDQAGALIGEAPVLGPTQQPVRAGDRSYTLTFSVFKGIAPPRPTTLRLDIATRIDRVLIPFECRDLPVGDPR